MTQCLPQPRAPLARPREHSGSRSAITRSHDGTKIRILGRARTVELPEQVDINMGMLRCWRIEDAPAFAVLWPGDVGPLIDEQTAARAVERWQLAGALDEAQAWAIVVEGNIMGGMEARWDSTHRNVTLGYWLATSARGYGIATDCLAALTQQFHVQNVSCELEIAASNRASQNVASRAGYQLCEGRAASGLMLWASPA